MNQKIYPSSNDNCLLKRIEKLEEAALKFGFYWENFHQLIEQIQSECIEIQDAWDQNNPTLLQEEVGDLIQATISLAIFCKLNPSETLQKSIEKFERRYNTVVQMAQEDGYDNLQKQPFEVLMNYWNKAKAKNQL